MTKNGFMTISLITLVAVFFGSILFPVRAEKIAAPIPSGRLKLAAGVMCESIEGNDPREPSIVFSATRGNIFCFTLFDPVPVKTYIYHHWYFRETLKAKRKLSLKPPRWSTFTKLKIGETDKGPWRVEVLDEKKRLIKTLRFSIVD